MRTDPVTDDIPTLAAFDRAAAAVDAGKAALAAAATEGARAVGADPGPLLRDLAARYPHVHDGHALARRFLADCRAAGRPTDLADALARRLDHLATVVRAVPADLRHVPAGFVATQGLYWASQTVEVVGPNGTWAEYRAVAPAFLDRERAAPQPHVAGLLPSEGMYAGGYVLGPVYAGGLPPFLTAASVKRHTAEANEHSLRAQARREEAARLAREDEARRREAARLARPLTVADLERLRAEYALREVA